jgi:ribonuclease D
MSWLTEYKAIPSHFRRILMNERIIKGIAGGEADARNFWLDFGLSVYGMVDVGLMLKFSSPKRYADFRGCGLSLKTCVLDVFGLYLDKELQSTTDWTKNVFTHEEIICEQS